MLELTLTREQRRLQGLSRELAKDFATRAGQHDQERSSPIENFAKLHDAGIFGLVIPAEYGGLGGQSVEYGLVAGELAQGCAATTMAFSMHICATGVMFRGAPVAPEKLREIADLVIGQGKLICASASEPGVTGQLATKEQDRDMLTKQEIALRYLNDLGRASPSLIDNITDDAEHHIIAQLLPFGPFVGKPAIRDQFVPLLRQVFPCGLEFTTQRLIAEDSYVAVECSSRGDLRDGKIYANRYFFLFEFAADRIKMVKEYNDSHYAKETLMLS